MYDLINEEIKNIRNKYLNSAREIASAYYSELSLTKDYQGRQMFELLQNADDAASNSSGKVLVSFDNNVLTVSNTGTAFDFDGITSLFYPYQSTKRIHTNKIGCKGLGFRSILSWTDDVTIATEEFTIQFSKKYAIEFLKGILEEKPSLKNDLKSRTDEKWPIAILTSPHVISKKMFVEGYSTSIIMKCKPQYAIDIENQIENLEFEELIFLPNLTEIEIVSPKYHRIFNKIVDGDDVVIEAVDKNNNSSTCVTWHLYKKTGHISDDSGTEKDYEFIIAYDKSGEKQGEVLYSYFKTDVKLEFPALIHGTFELTSDRNNLEKESKVNERLFPLLADFIVQTAVDISKKQKECNYVPLSLIISPNIDNILSSKFKFDVLLKEKAREKKILPSISNEYISLDDAPRYASQAFDEIVHPHCFPTLLKRADENYIRDYLVRDLGIGFYDYESLCELINNDDEPYSIEERVSLISLIENKFYIKSDKCFPHLLVDSNGKSINDNIKVYPFPSEEKIIDLPNWVDIKFLNQEMEQLLCSKFDISNNRRQLVAKLSSYNLEEYSFDRLLRGVVNQVDDELVSKEKCSDILNWLWKYYNLEEHQDIQDVKVKVICRDGTIKYAKECYIGSEYGNELGERLVKNYSNSFVAWKQLGIECQDPSDLIGFLEWLGVSKYPRLFRGSIPKNAREAYLDICYPLYVQRDNYKYNKTEFSAWNVSSIMVGFFEHLEDILMKADFNDILAWFILDDTIRTRLTCETEEKNAFSYIKGTPYKKIDERIVTPPYLKSYLRYYLSIAKWIPGKNGEKNFPAYCCFEDLGLEPLITSPLFILLYSFGVIPHSFFNTLVK